MLTTIAFIPQVRHSWMTRDLSGISLRMYSLFTLGVALWFIYGLALGNWPIAITNAITLVLVHDSGESSVKTGLQGVLGTVWTQ